MSNTAPTGKTRVAKMIVFPIILILLIGFVSFLVGSDENDKTPQKILWRLDVVKEITVKLDSLKQQVIVPTEGKKVTIKWINPKVEGDSLIDWRTHGPFGIDGGNILSGGWVKPPKEHPEISDDKRVSFWSFTLDEGSPVELVVKIWDKIPITEP